MVRRILAAVLGSLVSFACAGPARAEGLAGHNHDVRFNLGAFSAVGFIGATYSYSPISALELEAGLGWGMTGLQLSAMPKVSLGNARHRFILGAGPSAGIDAQGGEHVHTSYWLNAEVGYAYRSKSGFSLLVATGITAALGGRMRALCLFEECSDEERGAGSKVEDILFPQARVAVGFWD